MDIQQILEILKTRNIFITGGGGVGKSYTVNKLKEKLPVIITSSTGISAVNICGQTIHSWAGIGVCGRPIGQVIGFLNSSKGKSKRKEICDAEYLVIDEISMLNSFTFDYIDKVLQAARNNSAPFGGLRVILVGDFYQLPPVKIGENTVVGENEFLVDYCYNSLAWKSLDLYTINLEKVHRQADANFIKTLNNARTGRCDCQDMKLLATRNYMTEASIPKEVVRLYSVNEKADAENLNRFTELEGKSRKYLSLDRVRTYKNGTNCMVNASQNNLPKWDWDKYVAFDKACRIPKILEVKKGARVMLLTNKSFETGLVNGSLGNVTALADNRIKVKFDNGEEVWIDSETTEIKEGKQVKISREQIPLRLAYAITVHKAQGLTLDKVFVDFDRIFAAGQAYVALSRAKSLEGLFIKNFDPDKIFVDKSIVKFYEGIPHAK